MHWLREGDMNTKFFHISAVARSKVKKVTKLHNDQGVTVTTQTDLCELAKGYFDVLFAPKVGLHEPVLKLVPACIAMEDNNYLTTPITKEELRKALFQMNPDKSPGPDGFNPTFF
jgi:hypothetical protein